MNAVLIFFSTFAAMEFIAWSLHKYVMHGPGWILHADHHDPDHKGTFQKNDYFAIFFFLPSFLSILFGSIYANAELSGFGYGIMAYGFAYFTVHEVIIHRRLKFIKSNNFYFDALVSAHKKHHAVHTKEGGSNFGMLIVALHYFVNAFKRRKKRDGLLS